MAGGLRVWAAATRIISWSGCRSFSASAIRPPGSGLRSALPRRSLFNHRALHARSGSACCRLRVEKAAPRYRRAAQYFYEHHYCFLKKLFFLYPLLTYSGDIIHTVMQYLNLLGRPAKIQLKGPFDLRLLPYRCADIRHIDPLPFGIIF